MKLTPSVRLIPLVAAIILLGACRDGTGSVPVASVQIQLPASQALVGDVYIALAVARDAQNNVIAAPPTAAWSSSNTAVATVDPTSGRITAVGTGSTNIRVQVGAASDMVPLTVVTDIFANCGMRSMAVGATYNGNLGVGPCRFEDGTNVDLFEVTLTAQRTVTATMTSDAVDAYIVLWDRFGTYIDEDDDSAGGTNSRLITTLPPGRYVYGATSYFAGETGAYTFRLQ